MLKNLTKLETEVAGKVFQFICDMDVSTSHVKEALFQMIKHIGMIEDNLKAAREQSQATPQEEVKDDSSAS